MVFRVHSTSFLFLTATILACSLVGCGGGSGGGGNGETTPTPSATSTPVANPLQVPRLVINWGKRSRATASLTSALSATIQLRSAAADGSDIVFTADRDTTLDAHEQRYLAPIAARVAPLDMVITFYSAAGGQGDKVGQATATVQMLADGTVPAVAVHGVITSVEVAPAQVAYVGEKSDLAVSCKDGQGTLVAISPGSVSGTITGGSAARVDGVQVEGIAPGQAQVVAQVDGVASPAQTINVTTRILVAVTPSAPHVAVGKTVALSAILSAVPAGASSEVTWRVVETGGGTVTSAGVYTAPATTGVYTVVATSVYDASKQTTIPMTVEAGNVSVGAEFPGSGNVEVGID